MSIGLVAGASRGASVLDGQLLKAHDPVALAPVPAHPRRLVFLGTPPAAVVALEGLVERGFDVPLVVTRPDRRRGRGAALSPSPVKAAAEALGLPVAHDVDAALGVGADLGVVVAFGQLIKAHVLAELPMVNVHFSLLPRWRGAAPVERALLAGDTETGVCLMQLEEGLDTGPVYACDRVAVGPRATAVGLRADLARRGADLLLQNLTAGLASARPQEGEPSYAAKIDPAELQLDWSLPAAALDRVVRVGGAWTTFRGERLKVGAAAPAPGTAPPGALDGVRVGTGDGVLELHTVQPPGRRPMTAADWRRGARPGPDERLGG